MIKIEQESSTENALKILHLIPEFDGSFCTEDLEKRLNDGAIVLVAFWNNKPAGCKIAYNRFKDGSVYSWLGGVIPEFRNKGIAQRLNTVLEKEAKEKGYTSIVFKTRNRFTSMLHFALKNGYSIIGFEEKEKISENRIILKKSI